MYGWNRIKIEQTYKKRGQSGLNHEKNGKSQKLGFTCRSGGVEDNDISIISIH